MERNFSLYEEHYGKEKNNVRCPAFLSMNYWVNLHTEETVMWITASENCIILHFMGPSYRGRIQ